ncbi:ankyrin repeat domain-containing protein [Sphingobium phenoxybenzoativorans]|uniref:Ankyrin repeat domain-containing protein n=2 Tax=Sphingobium phenoxybenzoativorans TaxID=1592790 RepID=A0A975Q261_9SPHN|nr:ankyrin repeat domain-containing protein [Sphingobium phenoxybenzoativorans]
MQQFKGRRSSAIRAAGAALAALMLTVPSIAPAQFSDSYNFLKAVKDRDGDKATTALNKPGTTIVNTRDVTTGETALHIVIARRDTTWLGFLLGKGANPNLADNRGETPLLSAVQLRFIDGVRYLLGNGAQVDKPNDNGETALIRAVQLRDVAMTRLLVSLGANPEKRDSIAGMSARDYATRDGRTPGLIQALDEAKPAKATSGPVQGPSL